MFVGDKVRTPDGVGFVDGVVRWRDRLLELDDTEAREFAANCRRECGPDFRELWGEVMVRVGGATRRYRLAQITILEGRDAIR